MGGDLEITGKPEDEGCLAPARADMHRLSGELLDCVQVLEALTASTEDEFLYIGSKLRDFYARAVSISELSCFIAEMMSGGEISTTISGLRTVKSAMTAYLERSESEFAAGMKRLHRIAALLNQLPEDIEELQRITKSLRALGFSIMVQNASLRKPQGGIDALGRDIQKLSASVSEKSSHVGAGTKSLLEVITASLSALSGLQTRQRKRGEEALRKMDESILSLQCKYEYSGSVIKAISEGSQDISARIGEIVTSLQFHDIARQLFENSKEAFMRMHGGLSVSATHSIDSRFSRELGNFCSEQNTLLATTRDTFVSALEKSLGNLRVTARLVTEIIGRTERIGESEPGMGGAFLGGAEELLADVRSVVSALSENADVKNELSRAVGRVYGITETMSDYVAGMEEIGEEVELIAFNAAIRSDHIGEEGKALGVIAGFVQSISSEAQVHSESVSGDLRSIIGEANELSSAIAAETEKASGEIAVISRDLEQAVGSLRKVNEVMASSFSEVEKAGRTLSEDIANSVGAVTVHTSVESAVEALTAALARIPDAASPAPREGTGQVRIDGAFGFGGQPIGQWEFGSNIELF